MFNYIEVFYNRKRRYGYCGNMSPADYESQSAGSFKWSTKPEPDELSACWQTRLNIRSAT